ncbi:MAG: NAD(+) synthase, partial [Nannocystaceae bacterium]
MPVRSVGNLIQNRVRAIRDYHDAVGVETAELDVSGGIDSAVMCGLLAKAISPANIGCVFSGIHSSDASLRHARAVTEAFGVRLIEIDVSEEYESMSSKILTAMTATGFDGQVIDERRARSLAVDGSFRSCLRAPIGRYVNRLMGGGIRHGTGNECEDRFVRFYQKGGDGEVDTNPIAMLSKGEVYQLARGLGVPAAVIDAEPTHDLHRGAASSHDEVELKAWTGVDWTYSRVDVETGEYRRVGTIERMSRLLDAV